MRLTTFALAIVTVGINMVFDTACPVSPPPPATPPNADNGINCILSVVDAPQVYGEGHLAEIRATVHAACHQKPTQHHLHLVLEFDLMRDGHWMVQSPGMDEYLIPDVEGYKRTISHDGCIPGLWRVKGDVDGIDPGGKTTFKNTLNGAGTIIRTCPGP